jgi:hypothetical protein
MPTVTLVATPPVYAKTVYDRASDTHFALNVPTVVDDPGIEERLHSLARLGFVFTFGDDAGAAPTTELHLTVAPAPAAGGTAPVPAAVQAASP